MGAHAQVSVLAEHIRVGFVSLGGGKLQEAQRCPCWCGALLPPAAKLQKVEPPW